MLTGGNIYFNAWAANHVPGQRAFEATIAIALPSGEIKLATGQCEGEIIPEERGTNGFGYDPIFFIPELGQDHGRTGDERKKPFEPPGSGHPECHSNA